MLTVEAQLYHGCGINHALTQQTKRNQQGRIHCLPGHNAAVLGVDNKIQTQFIGLACQHHFYRVTENVAKARKTLQSLVQVSAGHHGYSRDIRLQRWGIAGYLQADKWLAGYPGRLCP